MILLLAATALSLLLHMRQAPESGPFLGMWAMLACGADLLTAFLLLGQFADTRCPSLAVLAAVYLLSGLMVIAHILTLPGVLAPGGLLHAGSQTAAWLWSIWHLAFTSGLVIYLLVDARTADIRLSPGAAKRLLCYVLLGVTVFVGLVTLLTIVFAAHLPVLMNGDIRHAAAVQLISRGSLILCAPCLIVMGLLWRRCRNLSAVQLWLGVVTLAYMCDNVLNLFVSSRFTIGWYVARIDSAIASVLVLCVLLYEVSRLCGRLAESEADLRGLVERAPIGMSVSNEDGTIEVANVAYCRLFGYEHHELVGRHVTTLFPGRYTLTGGLEPETAQRELEVRIKSGMQRTILESGLVLTRDDYQRRRVSFVMDITERKHTEQHLAQLAHYDLLTGLPNRALFRQTLGAALSLAADEGTKLGLLFVDLDGFKQANDTLGHGLGDLVLQRVAEQLTRCVRDGDTVARLAGDEFTVILPRIGGRENALRVASKILGELAHPLRLHGPGVTVTITAGVGISFYPEDGQDIGTLLKHADAAMYTAKRQGKNRCVFYNTIPESVEGKLGAFKVSAKGGIATATIAE
jgi:diguanylate cyclase (GGDEF)-like protein/PAS domain S-box-containing protein